MNDIMKDNIKLYEIMLDEYEAVEKECYYIYSDYIREFGDELTNLFELKVNAVILRKKIAYCNMKENRNIKVKKEDLDNYIDLETEEYLRRLSELKEEKDAFEKNKGVPITISEVQRIKKLYRKIVHMLHPDLHPELQGIEGIPSLWMKAQESYKCNDYERLLMVYDRIVLILGEREDVCFIEDIENKIADTKVKIEILKTSEPYTFKEYLNDSGKNKELHNKLCSEIKAYTEYTAQLEKELGKFFGEGRN